MDTSGLTVQLSKILQMQEKSMFPKEKTAHADSQGDLRTKFIKSITLIVL